VPLCILAAWSAFNYSDYGEVHILGRSLSARGADVVGGRLSDWLLTLGAVAPFSILCLPWAWRHKLQTFGILLAALVTALLGHGFPPDAPLLHSGLGQALLANGVVVLLVTAVSLRSRWSERREHEILIAGWIAAGAAFVILFAPFIAVRHVLPVIPAFLLALGRLSNGRGERSWGVAAWVLTAALGIALGVSDWIFADHYRCQARALRERFGSETRMWHLGGWGWGWYARAQGMQPYQQERSSLENGDIVVIPAVTSGGKRLAASDQSRVWARDVVEIPASLLTRVRTMRPLPLGGYYGFHRGGLPWWFSSEPVERLRILRIGGPDFRGFGEE
jgi:hypothetical protein